jgi:transcriptional regulator with XRE-family HTH domain
MEEFYKRLRQERKRLGLSQEKFSALGGVTRDTQMNYENGSRKPDSSYLAAIGLAGVDVLFLLIGETANTPLTAEEKELLTGFRKMDLRGKVSMLGMLDVVGTAPPEKPKKKAPQETYGIKYAAPVKQVIEGSQTVHGDLNFQANDKKKKKSLEGQDANGGPEKKQQSRSQSDK